MEKTLQQLAKEALQVQDASNLSGVVHGFSRAITRLREVLPNQGTDFYNKHPICVLWSSKIASLTNSDDLPTLGEAMTECENLSKS